MANVRTPDNFTGDDADEFFRVLKSWVPRERGPELVRRIRLQRLVTAERNMTETLVNIATCVLDQTSHEMKMEILDLLIGADDYPPDKLHELVVKPVGQKDSSTIPTSGPATPRSSNTLFNLHDPASNLANNNPFSGFPNLNNPRFPDLSNREAQTNTTTPDSNSDRGKGPANAGQDELANDMASSKRPRIEDETNVVSPAPDPKTSDIPPIIEYKDDDMIIWEPPVHRRTSNSFVNTPTAMESEAASDPYWRLWPLPTTEELAEAIHYDPSRDIHLILPAGKRRPRRSTASSSGPAKTTDASTRRTSNSFVSTPTAMESEAASGPYRRLWPLPTTEELAEAIHYDPSRDIHLILPAGKRRPRRSTASSSGPANALGGSSASGSAPAASSPMTIDAHMATMSKFALDVSAHIPPAFPDKAKFLITRRIDSDSAPFRDGNKPFTMSELRYYKRVTSAGKNVTYELVNGQHVYTVTSWVPKLSRVRYEAVKAHIAYLESDEALRAQLPQHKNLAIIEHAKDQYGFGGNITDKEADELLEEEGLQPSDFADNH